MAISTIEELKSITVDDSISNDPTLAPLVAHANQLLPDVLGQSAPQVEADWRFGLDEKGRKLLVLTLSDLDGKVPGRFAPDELSDVWHLRGRLHALWGKLLQVRSQRLLRELHEAVEQV